MRRDRNQQKIMKLFYSKAPNSLAYSEMLSSFKGEMTKEEVDRALADLERDGVLTQDRLAIQGNRRAVTQAVLNQRKSYYVKEFPDGFTFESEVKIGDRVVPRILDGDKLRAEDVNTSIDAVVRYVDKQEKKSKELIRQETSKIYRQMISIFGIFISIFAVILVSTDKILRFDPTVLQQNDLWDLFLKSAVLFAPVIILVGLLVVLSLIISKK